MLKAPQTRGKRLLLAASLSLFGVLPTLFGQASARRAVDRVKDAARGTAGSPYISLDSWICESALRLHELGYLSTLDVGLRPYTRLALLHALSLSQERIQACLPELPECLEPHLLFNRLERELAQEITGRSSREVRMEASYSRIRVIGGPALNDSFHVGQTFSNDYGRPFSQGINVISGVSGYATRGRFNLDLRGEYQHAPSSSGYNPQATSFLKSEDGLSQGRHGIIPEGDSQEENHFRLITANISAHLSGHQLSFGRSDDWLGPAVGGSMAWSNNAEPIYALRIDRIEPAYFPVVSRFAGPFRYKFFVGSLKGHDTPNDPWVHMEKVSFLPAPDLEFGFARTVIWGGKGHVPITLGTFLRSFFSPAGVQTAVKFSRNDPGARFSTFDFNYRLPFRRHLFAIYADSFVHDNVFPVSNPARAAIRPGLLLTRLPHLQRVDLRAEGVYTDIADPNSVGGNFFFYEGVQKNGYTNRRFLLGDAVGRENKGGNAWVTWHRRPDEEVQISFRSNKAAKDFIRYGTTQQDVTVSARLRPKPTVEFNTSLQAELWRAPLIRSSTQNNVALTFQVTWFPGQLHGL